MGAPRTVLLVSNHEDTADLYAFALDEAGFTVQTVRDHVSALASIATEPPRAIVVHLLPQQEPSAIGALFRQHAPGAVLFGLVAIQLSIETLKSILTVFDDVVMIPCSPDALVAHVVRLDARRRRQEPA